MSRLTMIKKMICAECGSDDVWIDATAVWDVENQNWELGSMFQQEVCRKCETEVKIIEAEYSVETRDLQ